MGTWRWGVAGTGRIATDFVADLSFVPGAHVTAVASRSAARAEEFGRSVGAARCHGSYESLAADPEVDIVYIATPHSRHLDDALLCLEAGKHVLCEKPLVLSAAQADVLVEAARRSGRFLMEAMWSRFLPAYAEIIRRLDDGSIGEPRFVEGNFGFHRPVDPNHRLFAPSLGGGATLDIGVYPIHLAQMVLGPPTAVVASGRIGPTGVDVAMAAVSTHAGGGLSQVAAAIDTALSCTARISGASAAIEIPAFMHCPDGFTVRSGGITTTVAAPRVGNGLHHQVEEVHRCLDQGLTESPAWPLALSRSLLVTTDAILTAIGLEPAS